METNKTNNMEERKQIVIVHCSRRRKGERSSFALDVVRKEYADHIRRALHCAGLLGYPPQSVANDVLIIGAKEDIHQIP